MSINIAIIENIKHCGCSPKVKIELPYDPGISLPCVCPTNKCHYVKEMSAALFIIAKMCKQLKFQLQRGISCFSIF